MHPWQSVLLIIISLSLFCYGMFYEEIKEESQAPLTSQPEPSPPTRESGDTLLPLPPIKLEAADETSSWNWAELRILLRVENASTQHISLHSDALLSPVFLEKVIALLRKNPTAREMILSPFQSSAFKQNESQILRALFSTREAKGEHEGLYLVCRGHSIKTSQLLASTVTQAYEQAVSEETIDNPLISKFKKHRKNINSLIQKRILLVEQIQKNAQGGNSTNIEEIALQAELLETTNELESQGKTLRQIESISQNDTNPMALLAVEKVANHKTIPGLVRMYRQLEKVLANEDPDEFVKKEVTRNLDSTNQQIVKEIKKAIDRIKIVTKEALDKKAAIEIKLVTLRSKEDQNILSNPKYELLKRLNAELSSLQENYRMQFEDWIKAKKSFSFEEINSK
jgi:hypothetical protein